MDETPTQADWRRWLDEHASRFLLFARQKARSEADAQDLVQDAVLEAMHRQGCGELPAATLVFATIHRRAIDLGRREDRRTGRESAAMEGMDEPWFDFTVEERERAKLI